MRRPCGDHAANMRRTCGDHAATMWRPCGDHAAIMRRPCGDHVTTMRRTVGGTPHAPCDGGCGGQAPCDGGQAPCNKNESEHTNPLQPVSRFPTHFPFSHPFPVFSPISRLPIIPLYVNIRPSLPTGQANRAGRPWCIVPLREFRCRVSGYSVLKVYLV